MSGEWWATSSPGCILVQDLLTEQFAGLLRKTALRLQLPHRVAWDLDGLFLLSLLF